MPRSAVALGLVIGLSSLTGCASGEPSAVLTVGGRNLRCPRSELETALHRETASVREYYVGCDFMYSRVLCDKPRAGTSAASACHPAKPRPPCFGGGCFREDPETFEWELDPTLASAVGPSQADAERLFSSP